MKLIKKIKTYQDGGIPLPGTPEYEEYSAWLTAEGMLLNPQDDTNYQNYLLFKQNNNTTAGGFPNLQTPTFNPTPKRDFSNIYGTPKPVEFSPTAPENVMKGKKDFIRPALFGTNMLLKKVEDEQQLSQENEYRRNFYHPDVTVNPDMYGKNRNSKNLSVSDTALTAKGAFIKALKGANIKHVPVEYEGGEDIITPEGLTFEAEGPKHEGGGIKDILAVGSKILSDRLKPSSIINNDSIKEIFTINAKKNMSYADVDKILTKKYDVKKNQEILSNSKYDSLFKKTADLKQEQANKAKEVLFAMQQLHNGDSNGEKAKNGAEVSLFPDGGKIDPAKYKTAKDLYEKARNSKDPNDILEFQKTFHQDFPDVARTIIKNNGQLTNYGKDFNKTNPTNPISLDDPNDNILVTNEDKQWGPRTEQYMAELDRLYNTPSTNPPLESGPDFGRTDYADEKPNPITPYSYSPIKATKRPSFEGDQFDYTQITPELYGLATDPGIKTWTKKYSPELLQAPTENIQANLNENQADAFYASQNVRGGVGVRNANIGNIFAQKYANNNSLYGQKYNFDNQARIQTNNQNNQIINNAENINFGRAKQQFDERDIAKEHEFARKNSIFTSLVKKNSMFNQDQSTKKFWFDILSKNYSYEDGQLNYEKDSSIPFYNKEGFIPSIYTNSANETVVTKKEDNKGNKSKTTKFKFKK